MNSMDKEREETNETMDKTVLHEAEEEESITDSSDLEQKKQSANNAFNVEGNVAQTQIFIQNLSTLNANYKQSQEQDNFGLPEKSYDLRDSKDCSEFVEKYRDSEYLAVAILLSTFDMVALGDLPDLKEKLLEYLPAAEDLNEEVEEKHSRQNPYISINTILTVIGGQRFIREDGQTCVGLGEDSRLALMQILEQFPFLKGPIVSWLIDVNKMYKYRTTFDVYQVATAFVRIVSLDIRDAQRSVFSQLYANPDHAGLLGILAYKLYEDTANTEEIENIILQWIQSDSIWFWRSASLAYTVLKENDKNISFELDLQTAISRRLLHFDSDDLFFIAMLLIQSKHFRSMIAAVFFHVFGRLNSREKRLRLAQIYMNLLRRGYYQVNASLPQLPLVACDTKQQQEYLTEIIAQVMSVYRLRNQLYVVLKAYLKELSGYNFSEKVINHICAYFYNMALSDDVYQQDVLDFLKNCKNKAATRIYDKLYHTYEKKGELRHYE